MGNEEVEDIPALPAPYEMGVVLTVRNVEDSSGLKLQIKKVQHPWTLSCGIIIDILTDSNQDHEATTGTTTHTAFLKLYNWRFAAQLREDRRNLPWDKESQTDYQKFVLDGEGEGFLEQFAQDEDFQKIPRNIGTTDRRRSFWRATYAPCINPRLLSTAGSPRSKAP